MIYEDWFDVSNYTPTDLEPWQVDMLNQTKKGVVIGLQDAADARVFRDDYWPNLAHAYYVDKRGRDLTIPEDGSICFIDIESGCFTDQGEIRAEEAEVLAENVRIGVYGNETSIRPVMGQSTELAKFPLWWANYGTPDPTRFRPFNGWTAPLMMQYSSAGEFGVNCDLDVLILPEPQPAPAPDPSPPEAPSLVRRIDLYADGTYQEEQV